MNDQYPGCRLRPFERAGVAACVASAFDGCHRSGLEGTTAHLLEARICRALALPEQAPWWSPELDAPAADDMEDSIAAIAALGGELDVLILLVHERSDLFGAHPPAVRATALAALVHAPHPAAPAAREAAARILSVAENEASLDRAADTLCPGGAHQATVQRLTEAVRRGGETFVAQRLERLAAEEASTEAVLAGVVEARAWRLVCAAESHHMRGLSGLQEEHQARENGSEWHLSVIDPWIPTAIGALGGHLELLELLALGRGPFGEWSIEIDDYAVRGISCSPRPEALEVLLRLHEVEVGSENAYWAVLEALGLRADLDLLPRLLPIFESEEEVGGRARESVADACGRAGSAGMALLVDYLCAPPGEDDESEGWVMSPELEELLTDRAVELLGEVCARLPASDTRWSRGLIGALAEALPRGPIFDFDLPPDGLDPAVDLYALAQFVCAISMQRSRPDELWGTTRLLDGLQRLSLPQQEWIWRRATELREKLGAGSSRFLEEGLAGLKT